LEDCSDIPSIVSDAVSDSVNAIQLDENNTKAYLRQGTALYHQDQKEEALKAFKRGLEIEGKLVSFR
jgi:tetratricopeptide (TPR) repeat protein